jgi:ABC-type glycerol-3-phosphate transport system substrate-binding protein
MYDVAQVLQRYNMTLGAAPSFANLLYQKGGDYFAYDENGTPTKVLFDQDIAIEAMVQHTEFFTKYGFPMSYDFANRFRTGEMPIGIADYNVYVNLKYTAPEISGLWEMVPMPGTLREDGTINRTQMDQTGVGAIMLDDCDNKDAAWDFIKWWSGHEIQTRYANDLEACLGISGRYTTANLITLDNIGLTQKELNILRAQFDNLQFIPIVPGNYYVTRGINNSTLGVINQGLNARELMTEWTIKINDEILRKRNEFNLNN